MMNQVGVQSAGWYDESDPLGSFRYIRDCGFEAVDFNIDHYLNPSRLVKEGFYPTVFDGPVSGTLEAFRPLREASEQTGVVISQMHAPFPARYAGRDEVNRYLTAALDRCFAVCEYLGCPAIVVHPISGPSREAEREINLAFYRDLIPLIRSYRGVRICVENIFGRWSNRFVEGRFSDAGEAARLVDALNGEAGGDYFGFCLDVGHANLTHCRVAESVRTLGHRLTVLHIHDNNGSDDLHMIPYSYLTSADAAVCDWQGLIDALKEIGYGGVLSFETFRVFSAFPKPVHTEVLKLISAIGHYWADTIAAGSASGPSV